MSSLKQQYIADSYGGLLHTNSKALSSATFQQVYDGYGNSSPVKLSKDTMQLGEVQYPYESAPLGQVMKSNGKHAVFGDIFPVGAVYFTAINTNPSTFLGGTWTQIATGRFIVGVGSGNDGISTKTFAAGNNFGEYDHTLTISEMPNHDHYSIINVNNYGAGALKAGGYMNWYYDAGGGSWIPIQNESGTTPDAGRTSSTGGSQSHNNTPPSFGLYLWQRTA
jgi:hypothetical protein